MKVSCHCYSHNWGWFIPQHSPYLDLTPIRYLNVNTNLLYRSYIYIYTHALINVSYVCPPTYSPIALSFVQVVPSKARLKNKSLAVDSLALVRYEVLPQDTGNCGESWMVRLFGRDLSGDVGSINSNTDYMYVYIYMYIYIYGSVSKPCTRGEHQNSW